MRLIDADELKKKFRNVNEGMFQLSRVFELIDNAPTVESERPQGEQIAFEQGYECGKNEKRPQGEWVIDNWGMYHCNYCMKEKQQLFNNFCSFCGADMRGKEE